MTITTATAEDAALSLDRFSMNDDPIPAAAAARSQTTGNALPAVFWVPNYLAIWAICYLAPSSDMSRLPSRRLEWHHATIKPAAHRCHA
jgi:hypothetical protein